MAENATKGRAKAEGVARVKAAGELRERAKPLQRQRLSLNREQNYLAAPAQSRGRFAFGQPRLPAAEIDQWKRGGWSEKFGDLNCVQRSTFE